MIFSNKYKRRIEVARWKANIALAEIEKDTHEMTIRPTQYIVLKAQITLLDKLLKGKEIRF